MTALETVAVVLTMVAVFYLGVVWERLRQFDRRRYGPK